MRGDGPGNEHIGYNPYRYSLHAWGWTGSPLKVIEYINVFPTCVGMDREKVSTCAATVRIPYMRGDGPVIKAHKEALAEYSLHAWGWTESA